MTTTNGTMETIVNGLQDEKVRLEKIAAELRSELQKADLNVRKVTTALKQLTADSTAPSGKKRATQTEVEKAVAQLLDGGLQMTAQTLRKEVEKQMTSLGRPRFGLKARLEEVLRSPRFEQTDNGFQLKRDADNPKEKTNE